MKTMTNLATRSAAGTAMATIAALKGAISNVQQTLVKKGGEPFLRFGRDGSWQYGAEDVDVQDGSLWAVNPLSITHGWVAWLRGKDEKGKELSNSGGPQGEIMRPAHLPMPPEHELPKLESPHAKWGQQFSVSLMCMTGEDKGEAVLYKTNSVGGIAEFDKLLKAIGIQLEEDETKPVPVVQLLSDSYKHKEYGTTYTPVFKIHDWISMTNEMPDVQAELDETEQAAPATPEPEAAKPTRTRKASVPATGKAAPAAVDEDPEIAAMMEAIAKKKAEKDAAAKAPVESEADKRKRELREQLAALEAGDEPAQATAPAAGEPIRRRRNPAA